MCGVAWSRVAAFCASPHKSVAFWFCIDVHACDVLDVIAAKGS
jgi:hypothetical protein